MERKTNRSDPSRNRLWQRIRSSIVFHLVLAVVLVSGVHGFLVKPYDIPSNSMEKTLESGDRIYVNRLQNRQSNPIHGQIVVFNASPDWGQSAEGNVLKRIAGTAGDILGFGATNHHALVKRIIGVPGDTVSCCSATGTLMLNGNPIHENYVYDDFPFRYGSLDCETSPRSKRCFPPIVVQTGKYLVLGDHRSDSNDSVYACRGEKPSGNCSKQVAREDVVGPVLFRAWPPSRIGTVY
ncbi:signal peptidase I [Glutamicibacter uratoxydans]|uniref:signal peptidase I n=1 Tax=Glutamicibacter uratoxydans TaxID=43667 RepID=UPI002482FE89|nr:signal peptidase I [Glutamicibacter uratoxydans]